MPRSGRARAAWNIPIFVGALCLACEAGQVTYRDDAPFPPADTGAAGGGGSVQRGSLTVRVSVDPDDAHIVTAAGIALDGLTVRLTRGASAFTPQTTNTDATGTAQFTNLLQGTYQVSVDRPLTAAELASLSPEDRDATILAAGASVSIVAPGVTANVSLVAARRGSLIISEIFRYVPPVPGQAQLGNYVEVYNNADTTIYLDGVVLFSTHGTMHSGLVQAPERCEYNAQFRTDPTGIWATYLSLFPGTGTSYPILPGEGKVIATNAVNHTVLDPGWQDLSRAHFEFIGNSADPNNPAAADMILIRGNGSWGHDFLNGVVGLALPVLRDTTALDRELIGTGGNQPGFRIPREAILDATAWRATPEQEASTFAFQSGLYWCDPFISPLFDRAASQITDSRVALATARRSLGRTTNGAEILQRTRTSSRDFERTQPLRRSLLKPPSGN